MGQQRPLLFEHRGESLDRDVCSFLVVKVSTESFELFRGRGAGKYAHCVIGKNFMFSRPELNGLVPRL
jgi:hypothetical protein